MKRLILFLGIIAAVFIGMDIAVGFGSKYYVSHFKLPGDYLEIDYLIKEANERIVILGSSVALNGVDPNLIADRLGRTCYNGGANGQSLIYCKTMLECLCKRSPKPELILLGIRPDELQAASFGRFGMLKPYYKNGYETIDRVLESKDRTEPFLLKSSLYRYNTIWWRILLYHFITPNVKGKNGFTGKEVPAVFPAMQHDQAGDKISDAAVETFNGIVRICEENKIRLMVFIPPVYREVDGVDASTRYVREYCEKRGIPFYDDSQDEYFLRHPELFYDNQHVNVVGCDKYTKMMIPRIERVFGN